MYAERDGYSALARLSREEHLVGRVRALAGRIQTKSLCALERIHKQDGEVMFNTTGMNLLPKKGSTTSPGSPDPRYSVPLRDLRFVEGNRMIWTDKSGSSEWQFTDHGALPYKTSSAIGLFSLLEETEFRSRRAGDDCLESQLIRAMTDPKHGLKDEGETSESLHDLIRKTGLGRVFMSLPPLDFTVVGRSVPPKWKRSGLTGAHSCADLAHMAGFISSPWRILATIRPNSGRHMVSKVALGLTPKNIRAARATASAVGVDDPALFAVAIRDFVERLSSQLRFAMSVINASEMMDEERLANATAPTEITVLTNPGLSVVNGEPRSLGKPEAFKAAAFAAFDAEDFPGLLGPHLSSMRTQFEPGVPWAPAGTRTADIVHAFNGVDEAWANIESNPDNSDMVPKDLTFAQPVWAEWCRAISASPFRDVCADPPQAALNLALKQGLQIAPFRALTVYNSRDERAGYTVAIAFEATRALKLGPQVVMRAITYLATGA